jgi:hypothetical protein
MDPTSAATAQTKINIKKNTDSYAIKSPLIAAAEFCLELSPVFLHYNVQNSFCASQ